MMDRRQLPQRKPEVRRETDSSTGGGNRPKSGRNRPSGDELGTTKGRRLGCSWENERAHKHWAARILPLGGEQWSNCRGVICW